jgi:hypothetical protein
VVETLLTLYFAGLALFAAASGHARALPFILLLLWGFAWVAWASRTSIAPPAGPRSVTPSAVR